jgi:hypothetical protein
VSRIRCQQGGAVTNGQQSNLASTACAPASNEFSEFAELASDSAWKFSKLAKTPRLHTGNFSGFT